MPLWETKRGSNTGRLAGCCLLSVNCIQEHQCHTIIGLIPDIGALWHCLEAQGCLPVTTTQTFLQKYVLYIQIRDTLLAGASYEPHTGKQSLRGLKQHISQPTWYRGMMSWPHPDSAAEYFKMFTL